MTTSAPRSSLPAPVIAALAAVALTGCTMGTESAVPSSSSSTSSASSSSSTPTSTTPALPAASEVWSKTQDTIDGYTSIKADVHDSLYKELPSAVITGDLDADPTEFAFKSIEMGDFTMRRIGSHAYVKGNNAFWKAVEKEDPKAKGSSVLADRWVKAPASTWDSSVFTDISVKPIFDSMTDDSDPKWSTLATSDATLSEDSVAGTPAYKIAGADGDTTVWISTDGKYNLLKLEDSSPGADEFGRATFSRWNEKFTIPAPQGALDAGSAAGSKTT